MVVLPMRIIVNHMTAKSVLPFNSIRLLLGKWIVSFNFWYLNFTIYKMGPTLNVSQEQSENEVNGALKSAGYGGIILVLSTTLRDNDCPEYCKEVTHF